MIRPFVIAISLMLVAPAQIPDFNATIDENSAYIQYDAAREWLVFNNQMTAPQSFSIRVTSDEVISFCLFGIGFDNTLGNKYDDEAPFVQEYIINPGDLSQNIIVGVFWRDGGYSTEWLLETFTETAAPTTVTNPTTGLDNDSERPFTVVFVNQNYNTIVLPLWWLSPFLIIGIVAFIFRRRISIIGLLKRKKNTEASD